MNVEENDNDRISKGKKINSIRYVLRKGGKNKQNLEDGFKTKWTYILISCNPKFKPISSPLMVFIAFIMLGLFFLDSSRTKEGIDSKSLDCPYSKRVPPSPKGCKWIHFKSRYRRYKRKQLFRV